MIVATVLKSGGIYNADHVYKIHDMVKKYVPHDRFVCLSDVELKVDTIPLEDGFHGWWSKMELFKLRGPTLFFDLDTIILKDISSVLNVVKHLDFVILRDFYRKGNSMQSSMMYWKNDASVIYNMFMKVGGAGLHSDQEFIETVVRNAHYWQDFSDGIISFKCDVMERGLRASDEVVIFHGNPRHWEQNKISY